MSEMKLSMSSLPYSVSGVAAIVLMVSVTDDHGVAYTGLQAANIHVNWILDATIDVEIASMTVSEYKSSNKLPDMPGVYAVELKSKNSSWSPTSANIVTFFVAVKEDQNHGQMLYTVEDASIATHGK